MIGKITLDKRKNSLNKDGFPIVFYLSKDSKTKTIRTGYRSKKNCWDDNNSLPLKEHPNYINILNFLEKKKILVKKLVDLSKNKYINFHFAEQYLKQEDTDIFYIEVIKLSSNLGRAYKIAANSFNSFFPNYSFSMIDKKVTNKYVNLLLNTPTKNSNKRRSPNGVISYMNTLTAAWNKLGKPNNPFSGVRPKEVPTKNKGMSDQDLIKIINNDYTIHPNSLGGGKANYLNYFLLCFYLGGIDLGDLSNLTYQDNVVNGRIEFNRHKGGTSVFVSNKIFPEALEILNNYNCKPYLIPIKKMNNYRNFIPNMSRVLEGMKNHLDLSKKPYSKAARYTFITRAQQILIDERITIEIVGHSQQSTHSIYKDEFPYEVRDIAHKKIITII